VGWVGGGWAGVREGQGSRTRRKSVS
jgi:hypothetical protein